MAETADIKDRASLKAWLTALPEPVRRDWSLFIAHRAAARVAPRWSTVWQVSPKLDLTDLRIWRVVPISRVAGICPTRDIAAAAAAADFAAADAADTAARAQIWNTVRSDADFLQKAGQTRAHPPLWPLDQENPFLANWETVKTALRTTDTPKNWDFWIDWYQAALDGHSMLPDNDAHWNMLADIFEVNKTSRLTEADWEKGTDHVNPIIAEIYQGYKARFVTREPQDNVDLFVATLFDFTYDAIEAVMRAVPMDADWKTLEDPDRLSAFLDDATDLREDLELMCSALIAEGRGMQGARSIATYANAILTALQSAEDYQRLRVDKLMEYGRILEAAARDEGTVREFGVNAEPLKINAGKLRSLIRNHFAHTLARMSVLRDIHLEDGAPPWQVLQDFKDIVEQVKSGGAGKLPPLAAQDAAVLSDVLDSVDGLIRSMEASTSEDAKSSFQRELISNWQRSGLPQAFTAKRLQRLPEKVAMPPIAFSSGTKDLRGCAPLGG